MLPPEDLHNPVNSLEKNFKPETEILFLLGSYGSYFLLISYSESLSYFLLRVLFPTSMILTSCPISYYLSYFLLHVLFPTPCTIFLLSYFLFLVLFPISRLNSYSWFYFLFIVLFPIHRLISYSSFYFIRLIVISFFYFPYYKFSVLCISP